MFVWLVSLGVDLLSWWFGTAICLIGEDLVLCGWPLGFKLVFFSCASHAVKLAALFSCVSLFSILLSLGNVFGKLPLSFSLLSRAWGTSGVEVRASVQVYQ